MKTLLFPIMLAGFYPDGIKAQHATLNINLYPVQTIEVGSSGKIVDLDYLTKDDYQNGVSITMDDQLKITSSGGFVIKVKSESPTLTNAGSEVGINATDITMMATRGTTAGMDNFTATTVQLSTANSDLVSSNRGGLNRTFSVSYAAKGAEKYVNHRLNTQDSTVYSAQLVFSIEPT